MKYRELQIQTQKKHPDQETEDGFDLLQRAGYLFYYPDDILPPLGGRVYSRIKELEEKKQNVESIFSELKIPTRKSAQDELFFINHKHGDNVLTCPSCNYIARYETAKFEKKVFSNEAPKPLKKIQTPDSDTIEALANYLKMPKEKTAKALMFQRISDQKFIFVVMRGDMFMSETKLRNLVGEFKQATHDDIVLAGATPGYASPIELEDSLVVVDDLIIKSPNLVAGANEHGYHFLNVNYGRDYKAEIIGDLAQAKQGFPCPNCDGTLEALKGLAVAQISKHKTNLNYYEFLLALAETYHDDYGLTLPYPVAPFDVYLMQIPGKEIDTQAKAEEIYNELHNAGISVLLDNRDERAGVKFNDADLIGCPIRVTVGEKGLKEGMVELKPRKEKEKQLVPVNEIIKKILSIFE